MDNLVPIVVALVSILIMFVLFKSISDVDVKVSSVAAAAKSTQRIQSKKVSGKKSSDDELDLEIETLIAQDIAKRQHQGAMKADTKRIQPEVLDQEQGRRHARALHKSAAAVNAHSEQETRVEKDASFKAVQSTTRQKKKKQDQALKPEDDINQKMLNFFSNNKLQKSHNNKDNSVEETKPQADLGGHVLTYGALNMARSWNDLHQ